MLGGGGNNTIELLTVRGFITKSYAQSNRFKPLQITPSGHQYLAALEDKFSDLLEHQQEWLEKHRYRPENFQLVETITQLPPTRELLRALQCRFEGLELPLALTTESGKIVTFLTIGLRSLPSEVSIDAELLAVTVPGKRHLMASEHFVYMNVQLNDGGARWESSDRLTATLAFSRPL